MSVIYELSWLQADDDRADHQQVHVSVNSGSFSDVSNNLAMTASAFQHTFTEDSNVQFFIRTFNADNSKQSDSQVYSFIATDPTPLASATSLNATFIQRV